MSAILILKSLDRRRLTDEVIHSWLMENEIFITNKNFSDDQYTVEITFIDEERRNWMNEMKRISFVFIEGADMINDYLTTCYSHFISISRPQIFDDSFEEDDQREPSPVHLSSAASNSSRVTCFSHRLAELSRIQIENKDKSAIGRGRGIEISPLEIDRPSIKQNSNEQENSIDNNHVTYSISEFHLNI